MFRKCIDVEVLFLRSQERHIKEMHHFIYNIADVQQQQTQSTTNVLYHLVELDLRFFFFPKGQHCTITNLKALHLHLNF